MKLKHIDTILLVKDIEVSRRFYSKVLELEIEHDWQTMLVYKERFAILQARDLHPPDEAGKFIKPGRQGRGNVVIYFQSENLEESYEKLANQGVEILHGIIQLPWERIFRAADPDGYVIEIGEPH